MSTDQYLLKSAYTLAAILSTIMQMSDDVARAGSPLDTQGKLLRLQNSLQKNGRRMAEHAKPIIDAYEKKVGL